MRCEEVRAQLPELADDWPRPVGELEEHLAGCVACSRDLARYRTIGLELQTLRHFVEDPPQDLLERLLSATPGADSRGVLRAVAAERVRRVASDQRVRRAALSLGGAAVGATAIGLVWWRRGRRSLAPTGTEAVSSSR